MKVLHETALVVFSIVILIFAIALSALIFGWLDISFVNNVINGILQNDGLKTATLVINVFLIVFALICIFADSNKSGVNRDGILMENEKGNLLISRNAFIKLINGVVNEFDSVKVNNTTISLDKEGQLSIDIQISVTKDVIIKDLSSNIQTKVKEAIKKSSDLDVKTVNIGIQNVIEQENNTTQQA